jgi:predicted phosphodiesterase
VSVSILREAVRRRISSVVVLVAILALSGCRRDLPSDVARPAPTVTELRPAPGALALPNRSGSIRFAVIGDSGRGDAAQHEVARQLVAWRTQFPFDLVLMLGDNIYDSHTSADYRSKFEEPYKPLLDAGVTFQAAIGNHDDSNQIYYRNFNMGGQRYYSFRRFERTLQGTLARGGARFWALDSRTLDPDQLDWVLKGMKASGSRWKIVFFHHPLYTSGRYASSGATLRRTLEPILVEGEADVVLSGHEHFYERIHPQHGIVYFISGAAGSLRRGDIRPTALTARGFDTDYSFILMEVTGDQLYFQAISRTGETVDAGVLTTRTVRRP